MVEICPITPSVEWTHCTFQKVWWFWNPTWRVTKSSFGYILGCIYNFWINLLNWHFGQKFFKNSIGIFTLIADCFSEKKIQLGKPDGFGILIFQSSDRRRQNFFREAVLWMNKKTLKDKDSKWKYFKDTILSPLNCV